MNMELGQTVIIMKRPDACSPFKPWKQGEVTALADHAVRVRIKTMFGRASKWINTADHHWSVQPVKE